MSERKHHFATMVTSVLDLCSSLILRFGLHAGKDFQIGLPTSIHSIVTYLVACINKFYRVGF